jgi:hypothetical protein
MCTRFFAFIDIVWTKITPRILSGDARRSKEDEQRARRSSISTAQLATRYAISKSIYPNICVNCNDFFEKARFAPSPLYTALSGTRAYKTTFTWVFHNVRIKSYQKLPTLSHMHALRRANRRPSLCACESKVVSQLSSWDCGILRQLYYRRVYCWIIAYNGSHW